MTTIETKGLTRKLDHWLEATQQARLDKIRNQIDLLKQTGGMEALTKEVKRVNIWSKANGYLGTTAAVLQLGSIVLNGSAGFRGLMYTSAFALITASFAKVKLCSRLDERMCLLEENIKQNKTDE